jgi:uncharacterized small protein (DUF1192 family)
MDENVSIPPKPVDLERFSEDELEARIISLGQEIEACKAQLARKRSHRNAAAALFGDN